MPLTPTSVEPPVLFSLGKYDVVRKLATGGMAEIFLARVRDHVTQGRRYVVLKRMLPQLLAQPEFVDMFVDEARIAAALAHPHIVRTYDVGVADGQHYLAMEYLHGEDLRAIMRTLRAAGRRMAIEHAVYVVSCLCDALNYAHEAVGLDGKSMEIVHRDVSPQNVVIGYDGAVTLLDFGIARSANRIGETKLGMLKGKIGYMSPEQCRGEPLDGRSDVFAAAILLFELSLGLRLYKAQSEFDALKLVVEGTVPEPRDLLPDYPEELSRIVLRGLARDPAERFPSARAMQVALEDFGREHKLRLSSLSLAGFMDETFGPRSSAWHMAQRDGKDLDQFLRESVHTVAYPTGGLMTGISPDDDNGVAQRQDSGAGVAAFAERLARDVEANQRADKASEGGGVDPGGARVEGTAPPLSEREKSRTQRVSPITGANNTDAPRPAPNVSALRIALIVAAMVSLVMSAGAAALFLLLHDRISPPPVVASPAAAAGAPLPAAAPLLGVLTVETRPPGAALFLDGTRLAARSPSTIDRVTAGEEHVLLVQLAGYADAVRGFRLPGDNHVLKLSVDLDRAPPPAAAPPAAAAVNKAAAVKKPAAPLKKAPARAKTTKKRRR